MALTSHAQNWPEVLAANDPDGVSFERFGQSVAIDGNYAIVGAWGENEDAAGNNYAGGAGAAYIYERINGTWTQVQKIVASDRAANDFFGYSVAISDTLAIVGANGEDHDAAGGNTRTGAGSAYIFRRNGGSWTQMQKIVASDRSNFDNFGDKVAISGTVAVVGAYTEDHDASGGNAQTNAGSAYVYELVTGIWTQANKIVASDRLTYDSFGGSVAISGEYILIGAGTEDEDANDINTVNNSGSAYLFKKITGNWTQVQKIVAPNRGDSDFFGTVVAISGNYLVVGSYYEDEDATEANTLSDAGSAYIFELSGGTWTFFQKIVASDRATNDHFGSAVAIADDKVIIGALEEDEDAVGGNTKNNAGSAYIFQLISGSWSEVEKITASDRGVNIKYGSTVAIFDSTALVGASEANSNIGNAYFYGYDTRYPHGGYTLQLDGSDDYVDLGTPISAGANYTIEAWVYASSTDINRNIVSAHDAPFYISYGTLGAGVGGSYNLVNNAGFPSNEWVHVAVTFDDAANTMNLYQNGILVNQNTGVTGSVVLEPWFIGAHNGGSPSFTPSAFFLGKIDEVRIWSEARTLEEIQANMNKELTGNEADLVAYYSMTDATGTSLTDNSGNSNTGTLTDGPTWKASGAFAGPDQALDFDGTDDYVSVPHDATLNLGADDFTIEWWVKRSVTGSRMDILNKKADDGSSDLGIFLTDLDKIMFFVEEATVAQTVVSLTSIGTEWTHIAGVRSGNSLSVYINGLLDNTSTASPRNVNNTSHLIFGGNNQGGSVSVNFTGTLDEMRIWNTARTPVQILANMYHTLRGDETGLQAYYRFDQQPDAGNLTAYDLTANANHGNLTNMSPASDWVSSNPFNTWIGSEDSDWSNADNWSLGVAPTTEDAAIFGWEGSYAPASGNLSVRNIYIDSRLNFAQSGNLTVSGDYYNAGTFTGSGTTTFNGSTTQTIRGTGSTTFGTLLMNKGGTAVMDQDMATGDLTLTAGTLAIGANELTINGAISQTSGILSGGSSSSLAFGGSGASTALPAITLNNLSLDRSNGISLGGTTSVAGILTLTQGVLDLNNQVLSLGNSAWVGGSLADNSHVDATSGTFRKEFGGADYFSFPVGDGALYSPITLNFTSGDFTSAYADIDLTATKHPNNGSSTDFISRYWHVSTSGISAFDCEVTAQYADADISGTETNLQGGKWDGVSWLDLGPVNTGSNEITATVSSFSDFTASEPSAFPVEWLSLSATPVNAQVKIEWATATELNSDYFGVESSIDQRIWSEIGTVKAAGTSTQTHDYSLLDTQPSSGRNFYRIRQVDVNGNFSYSAQVEALINETPIRAYPNPVADLLNLELSAAVWVGELYDAQGRQVKVWKNLTGNTSLNIDNLPTGMYLLRLSVPPAQPTQLIVVKQ